MNANEEKLAVVWLKEGCIRWVYTQGDLIVRVKQTLDGEEEIEPPKLATSYLDISLEGLGPSWINYSEDDLSYWVFLEEDVTPRMDDELGNGDAQGVLDGIDEYMRRVEDMPEPLRTRMRQYLTAFREQLLSEGQ